MFRNIRESPYMRNLKAFLQRINPCHKIIEQMNAEYFAMRRNEPIPKTLCEVLSEFWLNHWKWIMGTVIAILAIIVRVI